jgi:peptidoglycan/xylan/chitin deacetylase (PgdA/CDA1 family)
MAMISGLLSKSAALIPMEWVRPLSGVLLVVPFYHMVSDAHVPHVSNLYRFRSIAEFTSDVEFFARHFVPVTLDDVVDALNGRRTFSQPCIHLTLDDGFSEMHDIVVPILERVGVPATFFLNTAFLDGGGMAHHNVLSLVLDRLRSDNGKNGRKSHQRVESILAAEVRQGGTIEKRVLSVQYSQNSVVRSLASAVDLDLEQYIREMRPYLSSEQVESILKRGFSIGAHGHDHPLYADLPLSQQLMQTRTSMEILRTRFQVSPRAFAFPHNDSGVQEEFFNSVFSSERLLDVSFGTSGLVAHYYPRNIERVSMEKTPVAAAQILARQFTRATYYRLRSK